MKDIYEILNDVDIDETEMESMEVSDIEKAKVKKTLKKSIKKNKIWKRSIIAATVCFVMIGSIGIVGLTSPVNAAAIPVVGDIFRFLDNGRTGVYDKYKENANGINVTKESNGISVTIKDAIFDGKTLSYTYEIKSDKDLGGSPILGGMGTSGVSIKGYKGGMTGTSGTKKVNDNTYVGQDNYSIDRERKQINAKLNFEGIGKFNNGTEEKIKGNWKFDINLKAIESNKQYVNKEIEKDGIKVGIDNIAKTRMSVTINYTQSITEKIKEKWFSVSTDLEVKDDLGNVYKGQGNGEQGNLYKMKGSMTFGKINDNAKKLIIIPKIHMSNTARGVSFDKNRKETEIKAKIDANHLERRDIVLGDIVVDLEK
ncbi:DUF4179 domain-containing protein [Clostridium sp.]|jgi:hypothetical protein|uniref:DUF4179 domain-containing protein n=1 Tax=Clostridium sp. TaxID=1506 RepID=UPI00258DC4D6|nr:DUF4179 domain-containing protein [Clostridium sp.]MDF2506098.1 hypothetical protein [Clostridium sp.]